MKTINRLAHLALAIWVFNMFLWFMYQINRPAYYQMRAAGVQWFQCMDWDANGHPFESDQCSDAPPAYEPEQ